MVSRFQLETLAKACILGYINSSVFLFTIHLAIKVVSFSEIDLLRVVGCKWASLVHRNVNFVCITAVLQAKCYMEMKTVQTTKWQRSSYNFVKQDV